MDMDEVDDNMDEFYGSNSTRCNATDLTEKYTIYITFASSCLSMIGSALIILTFLLWRDIRTTARAIVVFLAIADFFTAAGYLFGSVVSYLNVEQSNTHLYDELCKAQSFITTAFPISSFLWTIHLAVYLYVAIVNANPPLAKRLMILFHVTGWGIPLLICFPAVFTNNLGGSHERTSVNWCFVYLNNTNPRDSHELKLRLAKYYGLEFVCGKFWEISACFVAAFLYVSVKVVLRKRMHGMHRQIEVVKSSYGSLNMERKLAAAMEHLDQKLIFIPLVFIFLRLWGNMRFLISFLPSCHTPCDDHLIVTDPCRTALYNPFLMIMQAACDPGQGWGNALIFVVFHKALLRRMCPCIFVAGQRIRDYYRFGGKKGERTDSPAVNDTSGFVKPSCLVVEETTDGHHTPLLSDECDKIEPQLRRSL